MTTIPTIKQLYDGIIDNLEAEYSISLNPFGKAVLIAVAGVVSMVAWLCYLAVGAVQRNVWYDTADNDMLIRFGVSILGRYPFGATQARYTVTVTGSIGGVIPVSTVFQSSPSSLNPGKLYQVAVATTLAATSENIVVNALAGGDSSTLNIGDIITATSPLLNVDADAIVVTENINPENAESLELYRTKIGEKVRLTAGSWNAVDYLLVGSSVTGVGNVYAYGASSTEVNVWIQGTAAVAFPGPSASPTVISDYETALDLVRPLPAFIVNVASSPINNIDVEITMGSFPAFTLEQQTAIETAVRQFVDSVHPFIPVIETVDQRNDRIATYNLSSVISQAVPGYGFSSVTFEVAGVPTTFWEADNGNIPFFNSIAFV